MAGEPSVWNVVVNGAWNTAILSPDGVRKRLFQLADGTPIELQVAIDRPGHFRISHDGLAVIPTSSRLEVAVANGNRADLRRAAAICQQAIAELPETPVTAAGVNVRFNFDDLPDDVLARVRAPLDDGLAHTGCEIVNATISRAVTFHDGVVNLTVSHSPEGNGTLRFNFRRDSKDPRELSTWVGQADEFVNQAIALAQVIGVRDVG